MESNASIDSTESTTSTSTSQNRVTRILIVEDHQLTRYGISFALEKYNTLEIIGEAENGEIALRIAMEEKPDIVLMDIGLPVMDGIEATQLIKKYLPQTKIVMLTSKEDASNIYTALGAGADSYCLKDISTEMLVKVIEMSLQGVLWLDPAIAKVVVQGLPSNTEIPPHENNPHGNHSPHSELKESRNHQTAENSQPVRPTFSTIENTATQSQSEPSSSMAKTASSNSVPLGQALAEEAANLSLLSPREVKILSMIVDTKCLKDIAEAFHKTPNQMNQEIVAILQKLAVEKYSNLNSPKESPKPQATYHHPAPPHNPADEIFNMLSINKPAVAAQMTHLSASPPENVYDTKLTGREIEILRLLAVNKSDDEIAYIFQISKDWVNAHITNIIDKLQVKDRSEAAVKARLDGILETKVYL